MALPGQQWVLEGGPHTVVYQVGVLLFFLYASLEVADKSGSHVASKSSASFTISSSYDSSLVTIPNSDDRRDRLNVKTQVTVGTR
jgi:hypothetical protein